MKLVLLGVSIVLVIGLIGVTVYLLWTKTTLLGDHSEAATLTGAKSDSDQVNQVIFTPVYTTGNSGISNSTVIPAGGNPVIFFSRGNEWPEVAKLMACSCSDASCSGITGCYEIEDTISSYNNIAATGSDGKPYVVHWSMSDQKIRGCKCNNSSCSQSECFDIATVDDWYVEPAPTVIIDTDNKPIVAYHNSNSQLVIVFCNDVRCNGNSSYVVDTVHGAGTPALVLGSDGNPVLIHNYVDDNGYFGNRACTCSNEQCTQFECIHIEGMDNFMASAQSIVVAMDESLIVAGVRVTSSQSDYSYKLESCRFEGTPYRWAQCTVLDQVSRVGYTRIHGVSATTSSDDKLIVAYYKTINPVETEQSLKMIRCDDIKCKNFSSSVLVNNFGYYSWTSDTSIVRSPDGMPIISYYEPLTRDLYVAKCLDQGCTTAVPAVE